MLKNINLSFPNVGFISIVGESGSGKSTLLNLLTLVDSPSCGEIFYKGKKMSKLSEKEKKIFQNNEIGVLFQHFNLFEELSCLDNVILPLLINGVNKDKAINSAKELFKRYRLDKLINQQYKTLSGGEKQRVALIRAIINKPEVIIADEPTGALDSYNGNEIMNELKLLSKNHLVIVVSHNIDLVEKYEDKRITINNGICSILNETSDNKVIKKEHKTIINKNALFMFLKLHFKKHKTRNIITFASISFSLLCLFISFGYMKGSKESISTYKSQSLLYPTATIAKKIIVDVPDSPIKISKLTRPNKNDLDFLENDIKSISIENNYSSIFSSAPSFSFDNKEINDVEFSPVYNFFNYKNILVTGNFPSINFDSVIVNEEFVKRFSYTNSNIINCSIKLSEVVSISNQIDGLKPIKDEIEFNENLKITGVVKEFAYLNSPRVYFSYQGLKEKMSTTKLKNLSKELEEEVYVEEIVNSAKDNDPNSSYSYLLFVDDINEVDKLFAYKEKFDAEGGYDISSSSYTISKSYSDMTDIISTSLIIFVLLAIIGTVSINVITSYSNFTSNKKESAILSILGANKLTIFNIYNFENISVTFISFVFALCLAKPLELIVNKIIEINFNLSSLISISFISFTPLLMLLISILVAVISSAIPFLFYENGFILEELKDE